jgi:RNA polymerase sigma-70 factor (ECF subfamily)
MARGDSTSTSLLRRALEREPGAWERIVQLYSPLVRHWCRQAGVADADIADQSQEVFAAVSTSLGSYRADRPGTSFRAWMRGIARNKLSDHLAARRERAAGGSDAQKRLADLPAPDGKVDLSEPPAEVAAIYQHALRLVRPQFSDTAWNAFWRVAVDNVPTSQVALELGLTSNTVRQFKSRVLRKLKAELGELIT